METSGPEQISSTGSGDSSESLPRHTMIGEFEIVGTIGEGGFGTVYLAIDHSLQRRVALKEYRPALLATRHGKSVMVRSQRHADAFEAGLKSFMNEARTLARFDHPALIHVYRVWQQNNTAYMAMPLCEGKSLTMVIRESPGIATQEWITGMMMPLLEAVSTLHASNIFHRDIAPDNVLIQDNGLPMLLDFGAARQIATDKTQALTVILKPGYAPIEQFADDSSMRQGPWTDIYAMGAVMYFAITGKPPPNSVARLAGDSIAPLTATITEGYSREFLAAIDAALEVRPQDRPQSIAEFRTLLERVPAPVIPRPATGSHAVDGAPGNSGSVSRTIEPMTIAPARSASELMLEPMHQRTAALPPAPAPSPSSPPAVPIGVQLAAAARRLGEVAERNRKSLHARAKPLLESRRGMQTAGAAAAALVLILAVAFVPNPFQPHRPSGTGAVEAGIASAPPVVATSMMPAPAVPVAAPNVVDAAVRESDSPAPVAGGVTQAPVAAADAAAGSGSGTVSFSVKPWGEVFVDGNSKGASPPLKRLNLAEGTYKIEVTNPGFANFTADVLVARNKSTTITHQFK